MKHRKSLSLGSLFPVIKILPVVGQPAIKLLPPPLFSNLFNGAGWWLSQYRPERECKGLNPGEKGD